MPPMNQAAVTVSGIGTLSALGNDPEETASAIEAGRAPFRPIGDLLGGDSPFADAPGAWIEPRSLLARRRYGPATNLCLQVARQAVADAGLDGDSLREAVVIVGSSRGNCAGWLDPWPGRRAIPLMHASNSMHSEMAAAVTIELGIRGPYHVLANGCSSGLDAVGFGWSMVRSGMAPRAIVIGADLPLVPHVLQGYRDSTVLTTNGLRDPYSPETTGFVPGEAGAALVLEGDADRRLGSSYGAVTGYWSNSDAGHPLGVPEDGAGVADCLRMALDAVSALEEKPVAAVCPHASGTALHGRGESSALRAVFQSAAPLSLHLLKPLTGHTVGASGALETAILLHFMRRGKLPPNLPGLTGPGAPFALPDSLIPWDGGPVLKISSGMGGHNAVVCLGGVGR